MQQSAVQSHTSSRSAHAKAPRVARIWLMPFQRAGQDFGKLRFYVLSPVRTTAR